MADWLSTGAGGTEGLEQVMEKLFAEHLQQAQLAETTRHNKSTEQNAADNYRLSSADRQDRIAQQLANDKAQQKDRELLAGEKKAAAIPIGASVPDDEAQSMMGSGAVSRGNFDWKPGNMGMSTEKGEVGPSAGGFQWKGTQDAITKAAVAAKERASSGPVEETPEGLVRVGPDNQASPVLNDNGDQVKKYHPPPQPDRVLIQTADGYMPRSQAAQTLAAGGDVPLATSSATRTMQEGAKMLQPHVPELKALAAELDKRGAFGPVMGRVRELAAKYGTAFDSGDPAQEAQAWSLFARDIGSDPKLNSDELIGQFTTSLGLLASGAGRVHGGARGGGSSQMMEHFKQLLSGSGTLPMFNGRMNALDSYLSSYAKGPGGGPAAPAANPNRKRYDINGNELKPGSDD